MDSQVTRPRRKRLKRWQKWLIGTVSGIILIGVAFAVYVYSYIKSISLDEIAGRHQVVEDTGDGSEPVETPAPVKLPAVIKKPVEKASDLIGGQEIESQDAVDIAAILLNSGLSFKEISYLQGNASYDLSNEEKQKIRDLLLEKLTQEEIELLRSITTKYGKGLVILDPDYPIEFVGETDPEQIKKNEEAWAKMQAEKKSNPSKSPTNATSTSSEDSDGEEPKTVEADTSKPEETSSSSDKLTDEQLKVKTTIDTAYKSQMDDLAKTCKENSATLVNQIVKELERNKEATIETIQAQFLTKVTEAEAKCDTQFQTLLSNAKAEYKEADIPETNLPDWNAQYEKAKTDARSNALQLIAGAIQS